MAAQPVPRARIAAALAAVAKGDTMGVAAAAHGVSVATLKRYKNGYASPAKGRASSASKHAKPPARSPRVGKTGDETRDEADEPLIDTLAAELRHARGARRRADTDAARRAWSKTIRELVSAIERIAPSPPPPPDEVQRVIAEAGIGAIELIEQFLDDPVRLEPKDLFAPFTYAELRARVEELERFAAKVASVDPALGAELRAIVEPWRIT